MKKIILILLGALLIGCAQFSNSSPLPQDKKLIIKSTYDGDSEMWNHIFQQNNNLHFKSSPRGAILPHHLIVAPDIARFYKAHAEKINPDVFAVLSPNHYQDGTPVIQTCQTCEFQTTNGPLELNLDLAQKIITDGIAESGDQTFINEHGIYNHAPFIKKYFPEAKILPITLKWETTAQETIKLGNWLSNNLPRNAFVIASVDFSHYIPVEASDLHDVSSYATIKNFDYENIFDLEVDSPPSLSTIIHLMEGKGAQDVDRLIHTNNQDFHPERILETTSHQFIAFYSGKIQPQKKLTILSVGNIYPTDPSPYLRDIQGKEGRFLIGTDFLIFNLPDDQCLPYEQNGLKISLCKFSQGETEAQVGLIAEQKKAGVDVMYVLYQFSSPRFVEDNKKIAHNFTDAGATIFIERGIKAVFPVENNGDHLIAYLK